MCGYSSTSVYAAMAVDDLAADQRKSVPSTHMRCMITESFRARATLAAFALLFFAIRMAQARRGRRLRDRRQPNQG